MGTDFDLDVTFDDVSDEPDLSTLDSTVLTGLIAQLPDALQGVATGLLVEKRTMSDVSQDLGIRQTELVARLHRAKLAIGQLLK
ncbi:MAG: hypothetical protein RLZ72_37 [Actinomycetota bacterium]|jgi:DNA-directed RNA polymerase specialized sigma24 family protein